MLVASLNKIDVIEEGLCRKVTVKSNDERSREE